MVFSSSNIADLYFFLGCIHWEFPGGSVVKNLPSNAGDAGDRGVQSLGQEDPLEKEMATDSSVLPCKILWMEEPGRLQSMGCKESDMTEHTHTFLCFWHMFLPILFAGLTKTPSESNLE